MRQVTSTEGKAFHVKQPARPWAGAMLPFFPNQMRHMIDRQLNRLSTYN